MLYYYHTYKKGIMVDEKNNAEGAVVAPKNDLAKPVERPAANGDAVKVSHRAGAAKAGKKFVAKFKSGKEDSSEFVFVVSLTAIVVALVISVIITLVGGGLGNFAHGDVKAVGLYETKTSKDTADAKTQNTFTAGSPILVKVDFKEFSDDTKTFAFEVTQKDGAKKGEVIRKGTLPVNKADGDIVRYISVVSSARTALEAGKYEFQIFDGTDSTAKALAKHTFTVKAAE
jgi:hypothetical protein